MTSVSGMFLFNRMTVILALSAIICCVVSLYLYRFKRSPGTRYLALMVAATAVWSVCYFFEYSSTVLEIRLFWSKLSYFGIIFTTLFFYFFSRRFVFREEPFPRRLKISLILFSFVPIIGVLTNDYHHLHWVSAQIDPQNKTTIYAYGPLFWVTFVYTYSFIVLGMTNLMRLIHEGPKKILSSVWLILLASVIPVTGNFMYVFKVNPVPGFDWTPVCFLATGLILAYINIRYNTFDLVPLAREKLIDILEDGVLVADRQLRIADFNQALLKITGKTQKEVAGKNLLQVFPDRKPLFEKIVSSNHPAQEEMAITLFQGKKYLEVRSLPLTDENHISWGILFTFRDITTRKNNEAAIISTNSHLKEEITEKEKLIADLDAFAHTVAHDLRDSIGSIVSLSGLIQTYIQEGNQQAVLDISEIISQSASKTLYVIKELLVLATVRQENIVRQDVDMGKVVEESEKRLYELIKTSNATIVKPQKWPVIRANPAWLEEVWINYMSNAVKYGGVPPVLELGAQQLYGENLVKFWIKDNGKGIAPKDQKKLFNQFTRLETTQAQGTGLGLSIVKRIIEKLGGQVGVFSNAIPGEGCLFYFILPYK
ncbi:MAG: histidine kinase N-terminal 7TM domain-containing protein [Prolixibacteraceae bacterium]